LFDQYSVTFGATLWLGKMTQEREFPVPPEVEEILDRLPPQVTLNVPDYVLLQWFPPSSGRGAVDESTLERAQAFAQSCGCKFGYHASIREGVFYRPLPPVK
jgi:hypothetical protein